MSSEEKSLPAVSTVGASNATQRGEGPVPEVADPLAVLKLLHKGLEVLPLLAPLALIAGWLTVSAYARALGVQPGDLGIGLTEVLVLAVINLGVGLLLAIGTWKMQGVGVRRHAIGFLLVALAGNFLFSSLSLVGLAVGVLFGAVSLAMAAVSRRVRGAAREADGDEPMGTPEFLRGLAALALVPAMLVVLQVWAAHASGSALTHGNSRDLPLALTVVLPADEGLLDADCVVRVSPRVYVHDGVVRVLSEAPDEFTVGC